MVLFARNLTLFQYNGRAKKDPNQTEGGEREQCNHEDGYKSLLI